MVYKLVEIQGVPKIKLSEELEKTTLPGRKSVLRFESGDGKTDFDVILLESELDKDTVDVYEPFKFDDHVKTATLKDGK